MSACVRACALLLALWELEPRRVAGEDWLGRCVERGGAGGFL